MSVTGTTSEAELAGSALSTLSDQFTTWKAQLSTIESGLLRDFLSPTAALAGRLASSIGALGEAISLYRELSIAADNEQLSIRAADHYQQRIDELLDQSADQVDGDTSWNGSDYLAYGTLTHEGQACLNMLRQPVPVISQGTSPAVDYGDSKGANFEGYFTPVPGYGYMKVAFFITDERAGIAGIPALESHGDDRTWDPDADNSQSRATFYVDFEKGIVLGTISPSCGTGGPPDDCHSALPVTDKEGAIANNAEFLPFVADTNKVVVSDEGDGVKVYLAIKNADKKTLAPRLNAELVFTPVLDGDSPRDDRKINVEVIRDPFPAMEVYRRNDPNDEWQTVIQDPSGGQAGFALWTIDPVDHEFDVDSENE